LEINVAIIEIIKIVQWWKVKTIEINSDGTNGGDSILLK